MTEISEFILPFVPRWAEPVWHLFVVRHPLRDELNDYLTKEKIGTLIHYPVPPHLSKAYAEKGWKPGEYPITENLANRILSLPIGPHIDYSKQKYVIRKLSQFFKRG